MAAVEASGGIMNLTMPVSPLLIIPYSTLGVLALFMPNPNLTITGMVATSTDTSNRSGFNDLDNGLFAMLYSPTNTSSVVCRVASVSCPDMAGMAISLK